MFNKKEIIVFRHLEEGQIDLATLRDGEPLADETQLVSKYYVPKISSLVRECNLCNIDLICSPTKRSTMTADLVASQLLVTERIDTTKVIDNRTIALRHGKYRSGMNLHKDHPKVSYAQDVYLEETFNLKNPWYRHGDPLLQCKGDYKYPEIAEIFYEPGESQADLSIRLYSFFLDLISLNNDTTTTVVCSHYVVMSRLLSLLDIAIQCPWKNQSYLKDEPLYLQEWTVGIELVKQFGFKEFFKRNNFVFRVDLKPLESISSIIQGELDLFKTQREQKYVAIV